MIKNVNSSVLLLLLFLFPGTQNNEHLSITKSSFCICTCICIYDSQHSELNEHLSSKSPQMHQLVSELKCSGKVLHHNWKYISTKQTFNRGSFSWATLNPVFGNVLRCRNTSGVSHSAYLSGKAKYIVVGCWSQPWGRTQTHCVWMQNT